MAGLGSDWPVPKCTHVSYCDTTSPISQVLLWMFSFTDEETGLRGEK